MCCRTFIPMCLSASPSMGRSVESMRLINGSRDHFLMLFYSEANRDAYLAGVKNAGLGAGGLSCSAKATVPWSSRPSCRSSSFRQW